jgi:hypothetical protein
MLWLAVLCCAMLWLAQYVVPLGAQIAGDTDPLRGFSACRFVPGTDDRHMVALKVCSPLP